MRTHAIEHIRKCALCLQPKNLRNSHVISESLYADLYEDSHTFLVVIAEKDAKDWREQKGIRERLLCDCCEQLLANQYESHGAQDYRQIKAKARCSKTTFTHVVDYRRFKLFQLTQLWRMAIATHAIWQRVVLPSSKLEQLRVMLLSGDPKSFDSFGVMMEAILCDDGQSFDAFVPPITIRIGDYDFLLATFAGFSWYYCAHNSVHEARLSRYFGTDSGLLTIRIQNLRDAWHVQRFADQLESVGKLQLNPDMTRWPL